MLLVRIEIIKGKSLYYKKTVMEAVHKGLVNALQYEDYDRFQRLFEIEDEFFDRSENKTDKFTIIDITMFPGCTKEQKARIYEEITFELYKKLEILPTDVYIVSHDPPYENWGLASRKL